MVSSADTLRAELGSTCARWRQLDPVRDAELAVDGVLPKLLCEPDSVEELAEVLKLADRNGLAVIPRGGGSRMGLGLPPRSADLLLSTCRLNRLVEYEPADLTVTVEAGLGLDELQRRLAAEGQFLALDPPKAEQTTVGGMVASNAGGPIRLQYGSARDLVIGTRVANPDGVLTRSGGRVVKNVAGYDLNKLYTGSLGTLGVIVELSFKLHPLPQSMATVLATFDDLDAADHVVKRLMRSPLSPTAIEVLNATAAAGIAQTGLAVPARGCALAVLVSGFEKAVSRVTQEIGGLCREGGRVELRAPMEENQQVWTNIRGLADSSQPSRPLLKISVPPARTLEVFQEFRSEVESRGSGAALLAHAATGLIYESFEPCQWAERDLDELAALVSRLRSLVAQREGSLVVESCPTTLKQRVDVWGEVGPPIELMRSLKKQLDPRGSLNPGRYVGGI
jgi:glycolate oxidase FAD binding subunit